MSRPYSFSMTINAEYCAKVYVGAAATEQLAEAPCKQRHQHEQYGSENTIVAR